MLKPILLIIFTIIVSANIAMAKRIPMIDVQGKVVAGGTGIANIPVSDGFNIALTKEDGSYSLQAEENRQNIFITPPAGYRAKEFYKPLVIKEKSAENVDFELLNYPEDRETDFSFIQISDVHVGKYNIQKDSYAFNEVIEELNRAGTKTRFIVATGDLTNLGSEAELNAYKEIVKKSKLLYFNCYGGHDGLTTSKEVNKTEFTNYEKILGPAYYSFNYGSFHFVLLGDTLSDIKQRKWLTKDLELHKDKKLVVFQHIDPNESELKYFSDFGLQGLFYGHWHADKIFKYGNKALIASTPPSCFGGIDLSPAGYRLSNISKGVLTTEYRVSGMEKLVNVILPSDTVVNIKGNLPIVIDVYDSANTVSSVECKVDSNSWITLDRKGKFTFRGECLVADPKEHVLMVNAKFSGGETINKEIKFTTGDIKVALPSDKTSYPMFQFDNCRTGNTPDIVKTPLNLAWQFNTGDTIYLSSPVVGDGMVFIGTEQDEKVKGYVYALEVKTGKQIWKFETDSSVKHTVVFNKKENMVYAASVLGVIYALDSKTGKEKWRYSLPDKYSWMYNSPLLYEDILYTGVRSAFVALEAKSGSLLWKKSFGDDWLMNYSSPVIDEGKLYFSLSADKKLRAVEAKSGKVLWEAKEKNIESILNSTPCVSKGYIYLGGNPGGLFKIDAQSGKTVWSAESGGGWTLSSASVDAENVYIGTPYGALVAVNKETGKKIWGFDTEETIGWFSPYTKSDNLIISSPVISGNTVYFGANDGIFYAVDTKTGKKIWSYNLGSPVLSSAAVSGNAVFISAYDGNVYAFTQSD